MADFDLSEDKGKPEAAKASINNEETSQQKQKRTWMSSWVALDSEKQLAISTAVIAFATIASVFVATLSSLVSFEQWKELKTAELIAREQLEAAKIANKQANDAFVATTNTTRRGVRAFLHFSQRLGLNDLVRPDQSKDDTASYPIELVDDSNAIVYVKNIGATPAFHVRHFAKSFMISTQDWQAGRLPKFSPTSAELLRLATAERGGSIIEKDAEDKFPSNMDKSIGPYDNLDFQSRKLLYYVDAYAYYRDVYNVPHYISQCFVFNSQSRMKITSDDFAVTQWANCNLDYDFQ